MPITALLDLDDDTLTRALAARNVDPILAELLITAARGTDGDARALVTEILTDADTASALAS